MIIVGIVMGVLLTLFIFGLHTVKSNKGLYDKRFKDNLKHLTPIECDHVANGYLSAIHKCPKCGSNV